MPTDHRCHTTNRKRLTLAVHAIALVLSTLQQTFAQSGASSAATSEVIVTGETVANTPMQSAPVGPYDQPEWTTMRSFGTSRVYVRPPGTFEFVNFWTPEWHDDTSEHDFRHEFEIGLPHRFQLDLYQNWGIDENHDSFYKGTSVELRYALANWGKIPLNPTLYAEWYFNDDEPDAYELKLLLGETFAKRWDWAGNLTFEQETGGARETEWALSSALTYALLDEKLNVGLEILGEHKTEAGSRDDAEVEFLVGPTVNIHFTRNSFITIAPLFGLTDDSPEVEAFVVAGFQFVFGGPTAKSDEGPRAPASMFGH
jgi:hypothetical protein